MKYSVRYSLEGYGVREDISEVWLNTNDDLTIRRLISADLYGLWLD